MSSKHTSNKVNSDDLIKNAIAELDNEYLEQELADLDKVDIGEIVYGDDYDFASAILSTSLIDLSDDEILNLKATGISFYHENKWVIPAVIGKDLALYFDYKVQEGQGTGEWPDLINFLKCLTLFRLPDHSSRLVSPRSSHGEFFTLRRFIQYCFIDNQLLHPSTDCSNITLRQINDALDKSKSVGAHANYREVAKGIRFWIELTNSQVIPRKYFCPFSEPEVFTVERQKDIIKHNLMMGTYLPLSEDEIILVADNAYEHIENRAEDILFINDLITKSENSVEYIENGKTKYRTVITQNSDAGQKLLCRRYFHDKDTNCPWFTPEFKDKRFPSAQTLNTSTIHATSKDLIGACMSILLLLTGMRIRELQQLRVGCCKQIGEGSYSLKYKTFKTSFDPDYGEETDFPVPVIIYKAVTTMEQLLNKQRQHYGTDYLFVAYDYKLSKYKHLSTESMRRLIRRVGKGAIGIHPHRFRKTIAWLLISRSEKNIDIIRQLFGHHSYKMTLQYILRNYELVEEVVNQLRVHYAEEFYDLTTSIIEGHYTGQAAERIASSIKSNPGAFNAQVLRTTLMDYVSSLLESGEPIFIHRVPLGAWCLSVPVVAGKATPCTAALEHTDRVAPDQSFCKYEDCDKFAGTKDALPGIKRNITFCEMMLSIDGLNHAARKKYEHKLKRNKYHLNNIKTSRPLFANNATGIEQS